MRLPGTSPAAGLLVMPADEFAAVKAVARTFGAVVTKPCGCGPDEPCAAHADRSPLLASPEPPPAATGPSVPVSGKSPGQRLHEARQAGGARRPRPWPVEDWEDRDEQLRALDEEMAEAASVPERERAERAEAKLAALRKHAAEWAARAPADDWGLTPADTVTADCGRAILAIIGSEEEARDA